MSKVLNAFMEEKTNIKWHTFKQYNLKSFVIFMYP